MERTISIRTKPPGPDKFRPVWTAVSNFLAMAAMVLQVLLFADHVGASAAKTFGNAPLDAHMGVFELCTGDGAKLVSADGTPINPGHDCPICDSAAVMAFGEPGQALCAPISFVWMPNDYERPDERQVAMFRLPQRQPIRAPPVGLIS